MIYIQYIHHLQFQYHGVKTGVLHSPPPLLAISSVLYKIEQNWMCQSHGILQLPHSLIQNIVLPLHLYISNGSIPKHCDLVFEDAQWLSLELSLGFHLNHIPINHIVRIMYIFLKQRNMKNIITLVLVGNAILYATGPILSSTSNGPQYLGESLEQLPLFRELFLSLTLR